MKRFTLSTILATVLAGGMAYSPSASANVYVRPELVTVAPGVQVVPDIDVPVFYASNYYWRFYGNHWWRSPYYDRGWVYGAPPRAVIGIGRPERFAHYRPYGWHGRDGRFARDRFHRSDRDRDRGERR